jgi:RNA polymerase sigma-70 factor (ECF subfamily)
MDRSQLLDSGRTPEPPQDRSPPPLSAEQIYHDYAPRVYHVARRMVRDDTDAEDVTQDVLLQVVRKLPTFRGESAFPTWLHRVTVNAALSHRRKRAVREEHRIHGPLDELLDKRRLGPIGQPLPEAQLLDREVRQLIDRAIAGLPDIYREVVVRSDVEGLPNAAIADSLGLSLPAMKSRLHRARLLLRDALAPHFGAVTS